MRWLALVAGLLAVGFKTASAADNSTALLRLQAAIQFYSQKLKTDPHDFITAISLAETYTSRARLTGDIQDYRRAESFYVRSLARMPKQNSEAEIGLASCLASQHRFPESRSLIEEMLRESPQNLQVWALVGDVALQVGDYQRAGEFYERYALKKPGFGAWCRLAKLKELQGDKKQAHSLWKRSCQQPVGSDPERSAWSWVMLGEHHLAYGEIAQAESCYLKSLWLLPDYYLALEHLAELKVIQDRLIEAISLFRQALRFSHDPRILLLLGNALKKSGLPDPAEACWKRAVDLYRREIKKGGVEYLRPLAVFYLAHGNNIPEALRLAKKDLGLRQDYEAYLTLARAYQRLGRKKEAFETVRRASPLAENDPQFCYQAAQIYMENGYLAKGEALAKRALELCPALSQVYGLPLEQRGTNYPISK